MAVLSVTAVVSCSEPQPDPLNYTEKDLIQLDKDGIDNIFNSIERYNLNAINAMKRKDLFLALEESRKSLKLHESYEFALWYHNMMQGKPMQDAEVEKAREGTIGMRKLVEELEGTVKELERRSIEENREQGV